MAHHGSRRLRREERRGVYREAVDKQATFSGKEYVNIDTQFQVDISPAKFHFWSFQL